MKDVLKHLEIEVPEAKKGDSLKPKKPARKDADAGPEPPKKQKETAEKIKEEPKTEVKPKSEEKVEKKDSKQESKKVETKKSEL